MNHLADLLATKQNDIKLDDTFLTPLSPQANPDPSRGEPPTNPDPDIKSGGEDKTSLGEPKPIDTEAIRRTVYAMKDQLESILRVLNNENIPTPLPTPIANDGIILNNGEKVIEGVFNGEKMIGPDGHEYAVPPNYASKSKLVEGDIMKLTITRSGSFIFKQIGPITRQRTIGRLEFDDEMKKWTVLADGKRYKALSASISFYKGKAGDDVVLLVPENGVSDWGAVENIIAK